MVAVKRLIDLSIHIDFLTYSANYNTKIMKLPHSINLNTYLTYQPSRVLSPNRKIKSEDFEWDINHPKSLITLCIEKLSVNWRGK